MKKVVSMVENDEYCIDVIHQNRAVQKALSEADSLILENHLKTCAANAIRSGKQNEAIAEIINVLKKSQ